jgi:FAD/FMN-containing dehydrogenase
MGGNTTVDDAMLSELASTFAGDLVRPGDASYEEARRVHNGLVDKRPSLIARCAGTADVVDVLRFATGLGVPISVRGGGHNVAGRAVIDDGVVIDLGRMKGITIDPATMTARAQGGVTWREFNREAAVHGLATTGGFVSTTGIAGLTLGGGFGWLMGRHGLAADNLLSAEVVSATGDVLQANDASHDDLFWALRGGGGNFGAVTGFEYRLHPLREVTGGVVAHPFESAGEFLRFYRDFTQDVPEDLGTFAGLVHAPDGSGVKLAAVALCHAGDPAQAQIDLKPLLDFGTPILTQVGPMPYPVVNTMFDDAYPRRALNYWKSSFVRALNDEVIDAMVDGFVSCPSSMSAIAIEHFHGAVTRVPVDATAVPHREPGFDLLITSEWTDPSSTEENITWTRRTFGRFERAFASRRYLNYLDDDDPADDAFGPNRARLEQVKQAYDPENVFRSNHNIAPA